MNHMLSFVDDSKILTTLIVLAILLGFWNIGLFLFKTTSFIYRNYIRQPLDFKKTYAQKDSWVLVTGGSDGIGEQICKDLAVQGFNICIVARNEEKMQSKLSQIKCHAKLDIKTRAIVADFCKLNTVVQYEQIAAQVADIDIAMVFLNAGMNDPSPFIDQSKETIEEMININALHPTFMIKAMLQQLSKREKKSAIVITSSIIGDFIMPGVLMYSSTKAFVNYIGQGLNYELKGKIDVLSFICGETKTRMFRRPPSWRTVSIEKSVAGCFKDIGYQSSTYGFGIHEIAQYERKLKLSSLRKQIFGLASANAQKRKEEAEKKQQ